MILCNYWPGFPSPNERVRAYQGLAVVHRGELSIGPELARFGPVEDVAAYDGRLYPNKAPGLLPLVVPAAGVAHLLAHARPARELALTLDLAAFLASGLPFLLAAWLVWRCTRSDGDEAGVWAAAAMLLASPLLAASQLLFSHVLAAFLLLAAFALLVEDDASTPAAFLGGLALGWAAVTEYTTVIPGLVLAAAAAPRLRLRSLAAAAGGLLPLALLAAYDTACFGSPLSLSSAHEASSSFSTLAGQGLFGISAPTLSGLYGLLFSPTRGLLIWTPFLALAVLGWLKPARRPVAARLALIGAPLALVVVMAGYRNWHGGWFAGPRYLFPVLPLLFVSAAAGFRAVAEAPPARVLVAAGSLWGLVWTWSAMATFPFPPEDFPFPPVTLALPLLRRDALAPSWLPATVEAALLLALALGAVLILLRTARLDRGRASAAALIAALALLAMAPARRPPTFKARLEYAVIQDLYVGAGRGALEALTPLAVTPAQRQQLMHWIQLRDERSRRP